MASDIQPIAVQRVAAPQHYMPPTGRELRAQAVHRLQVGLLGICAMLLIVALANIIMDRARQVDAKAPPAEESVTAPDQIDKPGTDPLADIGVAPAADPSAAAAAQPGR